MLDMGLNEVRSMKERRSSEPKSAHASNKTPQRSPLHEGAETRRGPQIPRTASRCLNEVRSTKERRHNVEFVVERRPALASTKSAPRRSGDPVTHFSGRRLVSLNEVRSTKERRRMMRAHVW